MSVEGRMIASELAKQEAIIERGSRMFLEVGTALLKIRDERLYREKYKTFESYCKERLGYEKRMANYYISASKVREQLFPKIDESEIPKTESQLREVAKAPEEKQAEVVQNANKKAWAEDREPTAKDYRQAVEELEYADLDDDDDELEMPVQLSPAELAVQNAAIGKKIVSTIDQAKKLLRAVEEVPGTELLVSREKSIMRALDGARNAVAVTIPHAVCPRCGGKGCAQCGRMGWVNGVMAKELSA